MKGMIGTALTILALLGAIPASAQYVPPPGIPAPGFGINEVIPPANMWVDEIKGNDANSGMVQSAPRRTLPSVIPGGTSVLVVGTQSGDYQSPRGIAFQGTQAKPAFIQGGTFKGTIQMTGSWGIMDSGVYHGGIYTGANNVAIRNCEMSGGGIPIVDWLQALPNRIVIWNCRFHDIGIPFETWATGGDADAHAVGVGKNAFLIWVLNSSFFHISGDGLQVNGEDRGPQTHHVYFGGNTCDQNRQSCAWAKQSAAVVMSSNTATRMRAYDGSNPGHGFGGQYGADGLTVMGNICSDSNYCVEFASGSYAAMALMNTFFNVHSPSNSTTDPRSYGTVVSMSNNGLRIVANNKFTDIDTPIGYSDSGGSVQIVGSTVVNAKNKNIYTTPAPTFTADLAGVATGYQQLHGVPIGLSLGVPVTPPPVVVPPPPPPPPVTPPPPPPPPTVKTCPHTAAGLYELIITRDCKW